ncbi:PAS domain-containing protein [Streptomyces sp. NPDC051207]|uniref:helix-turn-helix transcriptional regulator n=1 Tax=Streptomyces sp. NPDC051207 TaxID=3154641 RepID=UPI003424AB50
MDGKRAPDGERDAILAALRPVVDGLAATFGPVCEVVLHDYRRPEQSVVAVAGSVTGRTVGGAMSEIGMRVAAHGDDAGDELNHLTRTQDGTPVKSSTMLLRDSTGTTFGALCVNLDIGAVTRAHDLLGALAGVAAAPADPPTTTFGNDIDAVVDAVVDTHRARQDKSWAELDRAQRLELFRSLDARGVFAVRRSVEQVAARLGISRASAYTYLSRARATEREAGPETAERPAEHSAQHPAKESDTTITAGGPA